MAMATAGATAGDLQRLMATDGTAQLRDLVQGFFDQRAAEECRVTVVGADGVERTESRIAASRVSTPDGEIEVTRLLYRAAGVVVPASVVRRGPRIGPLALVRCEAHFPPSPGSRLARQTHARGHPGACGQGVSRSVARRSACRLLRAVEPTFRHRGVPIPPRLHP